MSDTFDRQRHRFPESRYFEDLTVGEQFYIPSRTVTEANFAAFQTVSADNHPIHYDVEYCRERGHPGPLAHGFQVLCFTAAGAGTFAHVIGDSLIAFIEQSSKFLKPVYPGDTLYPSLTVAALTAQRTTGIRRGRGERAQPEERTRADRRTEISAQKTRRGVAQGRIGCGIWPPGRRKPRNRHKNAAKPRLHCAVNNGVIAHGCPA